VIFVRAEDASGALALDARVDVQLGDIASHAVPAGINALFKLAQPTSVIRFTWAAQPGVTAWFILANDNSLMVHSPPARQLVTSAVGTAVSSAAVNVGTAATLIAASGGTRQSLVVQNLGSTDLYIGGAGVTVATGLKVPMNGGTMVIDKSTAAIYGVVAVGTADVRILAED
jgi:hypothetical protein